MAPLNKQVFAQGVGLIAERWREVPAGIAAVMAEWLQAQECTAEEYIAGVKRAIAEDEFSPTAKRILDLGRPHGATESHGAEAFARVLELRKPIPGKGMRLSLDDVEHDVGIAARRAVVAIGGASRLVGLTDDAEPFVRKDFAKHYAAFELEDRDRSRIGLSARLIPGRAVPRLAAGPTPVSAIVPDVAKAMGER